ncbi:TetR/AcrR family transcriptional regulator [Nocardioides sp. JQ2195]|nr:TetR/AcrR family transcriptional regulator [Nocardioides sp. JQ2195]
MLPKNETKRRPRGPEEVRAALLRAARSEWSERGPDAPLRAVATRANVNHGLIHHYVGNKEDLLRAVLAEDNELGAAVAARMRDLASSTRAMFLVGTAHPEHTRLSAWLALAGRSDFLVGEGPSMSDVIVAKHADNSGGPSEQMRAALALTIAAVQVGALLATDRGPSRRRRGGVASRGGRPYRHAGAARFRRRCCRWSRGATLGAERVTVTSPDRSRRRGRHEVGFVATR